ncbi:hypothetical protein ACF3MZ_10315 [Paenibacillaceae bacterium WGS1546]|uniref:hypothetical protein n=1 Tax=Cohnella sp. WGS1546 TaxID=3366810 RepID=UPI00372D11F6
MTIDWMSIIFVILQVSLLMTFIMGMIICKKKSFMEGFYFFLIMIVSQIHSLFLAPQYTKRILDNYVVNPAPADLSLGQIMALLSYIHPILQLVAVSILVSGLYKRWSRTRS